MSGTKNQRNNLSNKTDLNNNNINNKIQKLKSKPSFDFESGLINKNLNITNDSSVSKNIFQLMSKKADLLLIRIVNASSIENINIKINSAGMIEGSSRNAKDGLTFFGIIDKYDKNNKDIKDNNVDYILDLNNDNDENNNSIIGRHFHIRFDIKTMKYYIKDLGCGYGTFRKIVRKEKLKDSNFLNIGNSYLICSFGASEHNLEHPEGEVEDEDKILNIKIFGDNGEEPYYFNPKVVKKIYIGRDNCCNIFVNDPLLSRIHCTIKYKEDGGWAIYDGKKDDDENQSQESTNGTWIYISDETQIYDGFVFKNNNNAFECNIVHQKRD